MFLLKAEAVVLEHHHTRLEPVSLAHFDALLEQVGEPDIWQYMGMGNLGDAERLHEAISRAQNNLIQGTELMFAIVSRVNGKAVGMTGLYDIDPQHRRLELGRTWIGKEYRRSPLNTESKYLLLRHCFETLGVNRVTIKTDARNLRSQRAIERIGAVREGILRHHMVLWDGFVRDTIYYSVIAPEWPQTKMRLESLMQRPVLAEKT